MSVNSRQLEMISFSIRIRPYKYTLSIIFALYVVVRLLYRRESWQLILHGHLIEAPRYSWERK